MAVETQQNELTQHTHTKRILSTFKQAGVDLEAFEAKAVNAGSDYIFDEVKAALTAVSKSLSLASTNTQDPRNTEVLKYSFDFLRSIAEISPQFKRQMQQADLFDLDHKQLLANQSKVASLKAFMDYALRMDTLRQVHIDLEKTLREYYIEVDQAAKLQAKKLRENLGNHQGTARHEFADLGASSINNKRSNSMFDPVKVIGHLLSSIYYLEYLAPIKNKLFPKAKFDHEAVTLQDEPQVKLSMERFGSTQMPGAAAPVDAAPKVGGPGR